MRRSEQFDGLASSARGPVATTTDGAGLSATAEQDEIIELPVEERACVLAGPGTGKTWTLLQRAAKLTGHEGLPAADILVLSFTRAVVAELRKRDRSVEDPSWIRPETFDSFATRLLRERSSDERWRDSGFDARIVAASDLLESGEAHASIEYVGHILLDEVQDLVGVRARFVAALLRAHKGGFTAFGDPAQAIYDHEQGPGEEGSLLNLLGEEVANGVFTLRSNHRASGRLATLAEELRSELLGGVPDAGADAVRDAFQELQSLGAADRLGPQLVGLTGSTAVLCRDNATALQLSGALHRDGVVHGVRRSTLDRPAPGWVAALFSGRSSVTREVLSSRHAELEACGFPGLPDPDLAWQVLARLDPAARGGSVRASEVRPRISIGFGPWDLYEEPEMNLVVSSIHRAKGLEFDRCVILDWTPRADNDRGLEARVLFVALTRARRECWHAQDTFPHRWHRSGHAAGRLVKRGPKNWQTFGMEIRGGDCDRYAPAGELGISRPAAEIQDLLTSSVRPGEDVELHYLMEHDFGQGLRPLYEVVHAVHGAIGVTGAELGDALRSRLGRSSPARITDIRIGNLETVAGSADVGDSAGLGRTGLWLRPRLLGLGEFTWSA
jgi:hypothetical protein